MTAAAPASEGFRPHAIIIGSGFGGLAAAVRLAAKGWRVTVVEKLDAPGGRAYVFKQDGYTFDAGPTIITAPHLIEELWTLAGRRLNDDVDLRPVDPFYSIRFNDGEVMRCSADLDLTRAEIARIAPEDSENFERFIAESQRVFDVAFTQLADKPFDKLSKLFRAVPDLVRLRGYRTVYSRVSDYFSNDKMRIAFSFHPLLIGGNPMTTTAYYCLIAHLERLHGVHYTMGGMGSLVRGIAKLAEGLGASFRYNAEVATIETLGNRATGVTLASGETLASDIVVSNADVAWTYSKLLGSYPRKRWTDRKIVRSKFSMSLFVWYFGTNRKYEDVPHHMMVLGPRYRELLKEIFVKKTLSADFSLYLHRPTATDTSLAPAGCDSFYVLSPVPHLESGVDWSKEAEPYRKMVEQRLEQTVLPGLSSAIVTQRLMTPQDFRDRLLSVNGAAFALEPRLFQSAWFRPHNISEEVDGLYLVGAGTHPGAGIPGVISSAKVLDEVVPAAATFRR